MQTILIAEDEPEVRNYLGTALNCEGYAVEFAHNGDEVVGCLRQKHTRYSVLLLDLMMPLKDGFETLVEVHRDWPELPVITLSGSCTPANVATVLRGGASDFLSKPVSHEELFRTIRSVLNSSLQPGDGDTPESRSVSSSAPSSRSSWPQRVAFLLDCVGSSDVPVLLRGETGVGKEVLARSLHARSKRANRPFLKLNCAALPAELVESELFGYERGAFTGAFKTTAGKFEMASGGTILLDEIGDMDFKLQAKLLQVLQDREFIRLGASEVCRVDVRVMAATHCDLESAVVKGKFREDLYYRLNIIEVHIPPLRERKDEIVPLAEFFLQKYAPGDLMELCPRFTNVLLQHDWPGNVRELENIIRKFIVFKSVDAIIEELNWKLRKRTSILPSGCEPRMLQPGNRSTVETEATRNGYFASGIPAPHSTTPLSAPSEIPGSTGCVAHSVSTSRTSEGSVSQLQNGPLASNLAKFDQTKKRSESEAILQALNATLWNRKHAAKLLNIDYKALLYKMKKLGIRGHVPDNPSQPAPLLN